MSDALVNGLAGAGGGLVAQLLTYPLQAVNTRQQTERKAKQPHGTFNGAKSTKSLARGTLAGLHQVVNKEGWGGLYRGLRPSLVGTAASQGVYYYFYQIFRNAAEVHALENRKLGVGDGTVGMVSSLVVAALAGCVNVLLTNPIWVVVTRMQTQGNALSSDIETEIPKNSLTTSTSKQASHGAIRMIRDLYTEAGPLGFWKGVLPTLMMVSNPSIQFMIYETLLKQITVKSTVNKRSVKDVSATEVFILGAISKLGATVATYPFLVVKSRLQAKQGGKKELQYTGTMDAIGKIMQLEGIGGFYKGMRTKILQSVMASAILFMIKEELVKLAQSMLIKPKQKPRVLKLKTKS